jgi:quinol monooxygenase YgiN
MGEQISWLLEATVKPGRLDDLEALMAELVEVAEGEPGVLVYEWSISGDDRTIHVYERFADSGAVSPHVAAFREAYEERFLAAVEPSRMVVYGSPSDEARETLSGFEPGYMAPLGGFAR